MWVCVWGWGVGVYICDAQGATICPCVCMHVCVCTHMSISPKREEIVWIFPHAGYIWLFYQNLCNKHMLASNLSSSGHSHIGSLFTKKIWKRLACVIVDGLCHCRYSSHTQVNMQNAKLWAYWFTLYKKIWKRLACVIVDGLCHCRYSSHTQVNMQNAKLWAVLLSEARSRKVSSPFQQSKTVSWKAERPFIIGLIIWRVAHFRGKSTSIFVEISWFDMWRSFHAQQFWHDQQHFCKLSLSSNLKLKLSSYCIRSRFSHLAQWQCWINTCHINTICPSHISNCFRFPFFLTSLRSLLQLFFGGLRLKVAIWALNQSSFFLFRLLGTV